ncbi:hypothetical protein [Domibacillus antri]|uniref:hypothetical protein n=1 Tax=Domibacillus antri TaxID=1714264 RepID=UPI000AE6499E|nr:hypothetical protein [Domibacillus antri]
MALERNKVSSNPNRRKMTVADMSHPIVKENKKALDLLNEMNKKKCWFERKDKNV